MHSPIPMEAIAPSVDRRMTPSAAGKSKAQTSLSEALSARLDEVSRAAGMRDGVNAATTREAIPVRVSNASVPGHCTGAVVLEASSRAIPTRHGSALIHLGFPIAPERSTPATTRGHTRE